MFARSCDALQGHQSLELFKAFPPSSQPNDSNANLTDEIHDGFGAGNIVLVSAHLPYKGIQSARHSTCDLPYQAQSSSPKLANNMYVIMAGLRGQQEVLTRSTVTTAHCPSRELTGPDWRELSEQFNVEQVQIAAVAALHAGVRELRQIRIRAVCRSAGGRLSSHEPRQVNSPSLQDVDHFDILQKCAALRADCGLMCRGRLINLQVTDNNKGFHVLLPLYLAS